MNEKLEVNGGNGGARRARYKPERPAPRIPLADFLAAQQDPLVRAFLHEAQTESDELKTEGRLHI